VIFSLDSSFLRGLVDYGLHFEPKFLTCAMFDGVSNVFRKKCCENCSENEKIAAENAAKMWKMQQIMHRIHPINHCHPGDFEP
jgi:hypothetical protein